MTTTFDRAVIKSRTSTELSCPAFFSTRCNLNLVTRLVNKHSTSCSAHPFLFPSESILLEENLCFATIARCRPAVLRFIEIQADVRIRCVYLVRDCTKRASDWLSPDRAEAAWYSRKSVGVASREATDCLRSYTIRLNRIAESNANDGGRTGRRGHR